MKVIKIIIRKDVFIIAFVNYGAILRVNGKFINKNDDLFMKSSDTGYVCDQATYFDNESKEMKPVDIMGNYYVYTGDKNFMLCFYKSYFYVISNNKIIYSCWFSRFISETIYIDGFPTIKVEHLDKELRNEYSDQLDDWDRKWYYDYYGARKGQLKINRALKKYKKVVYKIRSSRWLATWDYNGNHYEVIFGYGIDPVEDVWNRIKFDSYDFSEVERQIIDNWFAGE